MSFSGMEIERVEADEQGPSVSSSAAERAGR